MTQVTVSSAARKNWCRACFLAAIPRRIAERLRQSYFLEGPTARASQRTLPPREIRRTSARTTTQVTSLKRRRGTLRHRQELLTKSVAQSGRAFRASLPRRRLIQREGTCRPERLRLVRQASRRRLSQPLSTKRVRL